MAPVDVFAEIVPGGDARGYLLAQKFAQVRASIGECETWRSDETTLNDAVVSTAGWLLVTQNQLGRDRFVATLYYGNGALELSFNAQGVLAYIRACSGYKGSVFDDLTIGSRLVLVQKHLGLIFDDVDELFRPGSGQSVCGIVFFGEAASLDDEPEQSITGIAVHLD